MNGLSRRWLAWTPVPFAALALLALLVHGQGTPGKGEPAATEYTATVVPLVKKYCLECHSTQAKKGHLDLERFATVAQIRRDVKPWQQVIEQLEAGEMPPKGRPQPSAEERRRLVSWVHGFLEAEAKARTGDPGRAPLRRLSNFEYDCTIRDLTGVDLKPTKEFPADGAGGEGFTNAAETLTDITPALFSKYLAAAKEIAQHAVLLPDGLRFSPGKTRRDWTDECTAKLRQFYGSYAGGEGQLPLMPYLAATVRQREALLAGKLTLEQAAASERLNPKYLTALWRVLTDPGSSYPLDSLRSAWRSAKPADVPRLASDIAAWQGALWQTTRIGSYTRSEGAGYAVNLTRQQPVNPSAVASVTLRLKAKPAAGQADASIFLVSRDLGAGRGGNVVWQRPRFEAPGKPPLLLRDYAEYGPAFEIDYPSAFVGSARYLAAVAEAAHGQRSAAELAKQHDLDPAFLKRWLEVLALTPQRDTAPWTPAAALTLLEDKTPPDPQRPAIRGWHKRQTDLPVLVTNASDRVLEIPGRISAHGVAVHPLPQEFVAVAWKSPVDAEVRVTGRVAHAHPACGNGVAWWLEQRRAGQGVVLGEGVVDLGKQTELPGRAVKVARGDLLMLAVDARDGDHVCDLTEIALTIRETAKTGRVWDLAGDIADNVQAGNPHADKLGNADTWQFVRGPAKGRSKAPPTIPANSVLGRWLTVAADPARQAEALALAKQAEAMLTGSRPAQEPDRALYDRLVSGDSPLFMGVAVAKLAKPRKSTGVYGLPRARFDTRPMHDADLVVAADTPIEIRLPAALLASREFVVDGRLDGEPGDRVVLFRVQASPPGPEMRWEAGGAVVAAPTSAGYQRLLQGCEEFRRVFPLFICFPPVVPTDEVVSLKMFHREDEPLERLFLDEPAKRRLDELWAEHRFTSRQPIVENDYLPQFIGFVTQDQPRTMVTHFEKQRPAFKERADALRKDEAAAIPAQLDALLDFAARAYRRPLQPAEKTGLLELYQAIRKKGTDHGEACRGVLTRILVAPAFLMRIERAPAGAEPRPVDDWELASRLSYFLWSSAPDAELRRLAAAGELHDVKVLEGQTRRMLMDPRLRALAIEFGTQWIHVRGVDQLKEKNEKLFPTFDARLRSDIYEEAIRFFQDLFQENRPVTRLLDADYTFLNDNLARHYGIPGVTGPEFRRVEGVRKFGRGGILGLAGVHARQSGASRTSPVLRGNWVVETLLGEKLPRPPANVPVLPDVAGGADQTTRQLVERHVADASCATCHVRIDPFGFAFEKYDAIGRWRDREAGGLPIDAKARLRDGTEFDGLDGLRQYLLTQKQDVIVRLFCRRLLGYALGRATTLSDTALLDQMVAALKKHDGQVSAAVLTLVRSPQFRLIRGDD